ncbi:MAG: 16S rRNA (cytosine(967)-C(5))-methyltransferase RsmB [Clostridia bacterium]|nr:16S rRNA (cytosine(967)-C(5))-methyltransferase RsmB [Clostridia bacterium]
MAEKINTRKLALTLLTEHEELGKYVNLSLSSHRLDGISREEKGFITALLYTAVERKLSYDYYIGALSGRSLDKIDPTTKNILRLGLCQLLDMDGVPAFAAVNESVKLARDSGERAFVNAILREADRRRDNLPLPDKTKKPERYLSVLHSFPAWIVKKFISVLGYGDTEALLSRFNSLRYTDLTVNTNKISVGDFLEMLRRDGIAAHPCEVSPLTVRIDESVDPRLLPGYSEGMFFVQDAASMAAVSLLSAVDGELLVDVCAAPGGKSFAAAVMMHGGGRVKSFDLHESKISLICDGAKRLSLDNITASVRDALEPDSKMLGSADAVICDVPCSGLGVLGKKSDIRYRSCEGVDALPELQYSILSVAASYLKPGGRMIYSTCTLNPDENEKVFNRFLENHPDFSATDFEIGKWRSCGGHFTFYPHIHETDGFFVGLIHKRSV